MLIGVSLKPIVLKGGICLIWQYLFALKAPVSFFLNVRKFDNICVLILFEKLKQWNVCVIFQIIISVNKRDETSRSNVQSLVSCTAQSRMRLLNIANLRYGFGQMLTQNVALLIGRAIIDKDNLHVVNMLVHNTFEAFLQCGSRIEYRNDDR